MTTEDITLILAAVGVTAPLVAASVGLVILIWREVRK